MRFNKKTLRDLKIDGKVVLLRLDLNVPIKDGEIQNKTRLLGSLETINYLLGKKCRVIILSHFGRIKSYEDILEGKKSLRPVYEEFKKIFYLQKVIFIPSTDFKTIKEEISTSLFDICILENTRYYDIDHESKKVVEWESKKSPILSQFWASLGEVFVNDAFGTSHRAHASNVGISEYISESAIGFLVEKELKALTFAVESLETPKVVILGGSKVSDKLKLIREIVGYVDYLIIGGGMSYTFLKAIGKEVGLSIIEDNFLDDCRELVRAYPSKIVLPVDHLVAESFSNTPGKVIGSDSTDWGIGMALDIGPKTIRLFGEILGQAKIIVWNGPMGVFEFSNYSSGTFEILKKLVYLTQNKGVYTLVGGGDSVAAAEQMNFADKLSFVSTGGGATLKFLEKGSMPGIEAIQDRITL